MVPPLVSRPNDQRTCAPRRQSQRSQIPEPDDPPLHVALGKAVRRLREKRGISQEELGYRSGLHRNHVGNVERGDSVPTLHSVEALATGLEITASALIASSEQIRIADATALAEAARTRIRRSSGRR